MADKEAPATSVLVAVRKRPLNSRERELGDDDVVKIGVDGKLDVHHLEGYIKMAWYVVCKVRYGIVGRAFGCFCVWLTSMLVLRSKSIFGPWTSSQHNMITSGSVNNWGTF